MEADSTFLKKFLDFLNREENFFKVFLAFIIFLSLVKLPALFSVDMQPWDEGMYAVRVASIHIHGDFFDQFSLSIGGFYSASHPPLLIWSGYFITLIFGLSSAALKMIPFLASLLSIFFVARIGGKLKDLKTGWLAAMIFSGNIIFAVFSKRFQFDIPYISLILMGFYFFIKYNETAKKSYVVLVGLSLGLCLMVKILVGFFLPIVLFITWLFFRDRFRITIKDLIIITGIGIVIALPWHVYMIMKYGNEFLKWFMGYHIYERALYGVEHNNKNSGALYHVNYLLSIIPYSSLIFLALVKDFRKYKTLSPERLFIWIWFLIGFGIITIFKTKLEVYILLVLSQVCLMIPVYIDELKAASKREKIITVIMVIFNILWALTFDRRTGIKNYITSGAGNFLIAVIAGAALVLVTYFAVKYISDKINLQNLYYAFVVLFFIGLNIYQLIEIPWWENSFSLTPVKEDIDRTGVKDIIYIAAKYRANPQFSFYFRGLDIGWKNDEYKYKLLETKKNLDLFYPKRDITEVRRYLEGLEPGKQSIIVERDEINRTNYDEVRLFMPEKFKLVMKVPGYEVYR